MSDELRRSEKWKGTSKGVSYEICRWDYNDSLADGYNNIKDVWNYYLYLPLDMFPESMHKDLWLPAEITKHGSVYYKYTGGVLDDIEFHCGITYYNKCSGLDGGMKVIKIGCDYNHYWDEGQVYNVEVVNSDAINSINSVFKSFDGIKTRCSYNGKFCDEGEGYILRDGSFYSFAGIAEWITSRAERATK